MTADFRAVVIGAGPAGLATSRELQRRGVEHIVFEREAVGHSWSRLYDSLTLHTGKHMSALPGMAFGRSTPLFPTRDHFVSYLQQYQSNFALPVRTGISVESARREDGGWVIDTSEGTVRSGSLVVATGIMSGPVSPDWKGRTRFGGVVRHSITYRNPAECTGRRVLVVGAGNSGAEIANDLARAGIDTTIAVRSGANVVPLQLLGVPIQYLSFGIRQLPRRAQEIVLSAVNGLTEWRKGPPPLPRGGVSALDAIPIIGFRLFDAIREGLVRVRGGVDDLTASGARFTTGEDEVFDEIILATGFRPALGFLPPQVSVDGRGFASRRDRVTSADAPDLYFAGHNYDTTGALFNIRRDAGRIAEAIARPAMRGKLQ